MIDIKDFYFIYVLTGSNYIKTVIHNFHWIPKECNVVIITNTPKCLDGIKTDFNLKIVDLEFLRDDWSREYEFVLNDEDEYEYMSKLAKMYSEGYRYPMGIMRYGIKWAYQNDIKNFALIDGGCKIGIERNPQEVLNEILDVASEHNNILAGSFCMHENIEVSKIWNNYFSELVKKYNINDINWQLLTSTEMEKNSNKTTVFDGYGFAFIFSNVKIVEEYFNIWNDITRIIYEKNISDYYTHWAKEFEWHHMVIVSVFSRRYNLFVAGHRNLFRHYYHPENDYFAASKKFMNWGFIDTDNRKDFIKLNRDKLFSNFCMSETQIKNVIYDFE